MDYFDYGPWNLEAATDGFDVKQFLEQSQRGEEERLLDELQSIDHQLSTRELLREQLVSELESKLDWYLERLEILYQRPRTQKQKEERLKQRIEEFYREIRLEKRNSWNDIQRLESEKRSVEKELVESKETDWVMELLDSELL